MASKNPAAWLDAHERPFPPKRPCYKCRFFEPHPEDDFGHTGICTRYQPVPVWTCMGDIPEFWNPDVGVYHTCGEWKKDD